MARKYKIMYYLKKKEKIFGPFPLDKLQKMVKQEKISPEHSLSEDKVNWIQAAQIQELFPDLAKTETPLLIPLSAETNPPDILKRENIEDTGSHTNRQIDLNQSSVNDNVPVLENVEKEFRFISVFWNPVYTMPLILEQYNHKTKLKLSILLALLNPLLFFSAMLCSGLIEINSTKIIFMIIVSNVPFVIFMSSMLLLKKIFSECKNGVNEHIKSILNETDPDHDEKINHNYQKNKFNWKIREIFLITGVVLLPTFTLMLLLAFINLIPFFSPQQIIALLSGLGIYVVAFATLLLYNACTRLLEFRANAGVFIVSALLLITAGITGFMVTLLIN